MRERAAEPAPPRPLPGFRVEGLGFRVYIYIYIYIYIHTGPPRCNFHQQCFRLPFAHAHDVSGSSSRRGWNLDSRPSEDLSGVDLVLA